MNEEALYAVLTAALADYRPNGGPDTKRWARFLALRYGHRLLTLREVAELDGTSIPNISLTETRAVSVLRQPDRLRHVLERIDNTPLRAVLLHD